MKFLRNQKDRHARTASMPTVFNPLSSEDLRGADRGVSQLRGVEETEARRRMALRGYRIHSGAIWFIQNDDYDQGLEEVLVANWDGSAVEAWRHLEDHNFPTSPFILCQTCGSGEADFGGECETCNRETVLWVKAGEA